MSTSHKSMKLSLFFIMGSVAVFTAVLAFAQPSDLEPDDKNVSLKSYMDTSLRKSQTFDVEDVRINLASRDMAPVNAWLAVNDEYVGVLLKGLQAFKQKKLDAALVGLIDIPTSNKKAAQVPDLTIDEVYEKYGPILSLFPAVPASAGNPGDIELYLKAYRENARQYANGAIDVALQNKRIDPRQAARLRITTSLVCYSDSTWTDAVSAEQPQWMKEQNLAQSAENYCLYLKRYHTAHSLSKTLLAPVSSPSVAGQSFLDYLQTAARAHLEQKDVTGAYQCANAAFKEADEIKDLRAQIQLTLLTAEIQSLAGNDQVAADLAKGALTKSNVPEDRVRAMLLRLKFLFQANQYKDLLTDVTAYKSDPQAVAVMDRLLYLEWITLVRTNKDQDAATVGNTLVRDFPKSPFASEVHYQNAIQFLVQGKYDNASNELEIIETSYPNSPAAKQAKEIRAKLVTTKKHDS